MNKKELIEKYENKIKERDGPIYSMVSEWLEDLKHLQELPQPNIEYLKEEITPRESMVEYLEGEKIIRPQYQKKYKTKQEVKAYNDGIKTSIQMIGSCRTMLKELPQQEVNENTSDGYHTFKELYEHRIALFIRLVNETSFCWRKSIFHNDGSNMDGWFIVMGYVPNEMGKCNQISYHLPLDKRELVRCIESKKADPRDGHTSDDVVERLLA